MLFFPHKFDDKLWSNIVIDKSFFTIICEFTLIEGKSEMIVYKKITNLVLFSKKKKKNHYFR